MKKYISESINAYPTVKVLVLTGGECVLLGDDLLKIIEYGRQKGLIIRIVTNAFWAKTYSIAHKKMKLFLDCGLSEINISTGDEHQKWVSYEYIVNASKAAMDLGLTCVVNIESHDNSVFTCDKMINDDRLVEYFNPYREGKVLQIKNGIWVSVDKNKQFNYSKFSMKNEERGCSSLFSTITINSYSNMLACCGLLCEYISCLRIGNLKIDSLIFLYNNQFNDFMKIWLYVDGPYSILKYIHKKRGILVDSYPLHNCEVCAEIFKDRANIEYVRHHKNEIIPKVMLKYSFINKSITSNYYE